MGKVDFSMPFSDSGWSMVVAVRAETSTSMWIFLQPLTTSLWLASLAFFCFTGFVVWAIEHRINPEFRGTPWQQFGLIFYFSFSTLVFSHSTHARIRFTTIIKFSFFLEQEPMAQRLSFHRDRAEEKLESNLSRFVVIIWVFVVLILTSSYTASLTSMLTVQKLQPAVTDVRELQRTGAHIGYQEGTFIKQQLQKLGFDEAKMKSYSTAEKYADALSSGQVAAVFDEIPYLKLFLSQYCDGYTMVGPVYKTDGFGFVFPMGSPLTPDVSRAVLTLAEGEEMALIEKKWFGEPGKCPSQGAGGATAALGSSNLSFRSFGGLFLITGVVSGLMLLVYLVTFVYRERGEIRPEPEEEGSGSSSMRRLRAWLRHFDQKDLKCPTFKTGNDDSIRDGNQTQRWAEFESVRNGRGGNGPVQAAAEEEAIAIAMSPLSFSTSTPSERINAGSSPASELGTSFEQRMQEAPHSVSVDMPGSTAP